VSSPFTRDLWDNPCLYKVQGTLFIIINKNLMQIEKILFFKCDYQFCHMPFLVDRIRSRN